MDHCHHQRSPLRPRHTHRLSPILSPLDPPFPFLPYPHILPPRAHAACSVLCCAVSSSPMPSRSPISLLSPVRTRTILCAPDPFVRTALNFLLSCAHQGPFHARDRLRAHGGTIVGTAEPSWARRNHRWHIAGQNGRYIRHRSNRQEAVADKVLSVRQKTTMPTCISR